MRPHSLLAYDADGNITHTLDYMVRYANDPARTPLGLIDFAAIEDAGMEMTLVWTADGAKGSKVWPEWLGVRAHEFTVELDGEPGHKRIVALVHKYSKTRRERADIEAAIAGRIAAAGDSPADIRDLVGGPGKPLLLDETGATVVTESVVPSLDLPIIDAR